MIGQLNEKPLHAALKEWYARPGDQLEVPVDGYVIDIVRQGLLIEIQTRSFSAMKQKLAALLPHHPVRLVHPVAAQKWLVKLDPAGNHPLQRRKSPQSGGLETIFAELVSFPHLLAQPNFSLEVLLIHEEEVRRHEEGRAWRRRGWVTEERRLLEVVQQQCFHEPAELASLLPAALPTPFTTADLAAALGRPRRLAQQMAYCLRKMGVLAPAGKQSRSMLYTLV